MLPWQLAPCSLPRQLVACCAKNRRCAESKNGDPQFRYYVPGMRTTSSIENLSPDTQNLCTSKSGVSNKYLTLVNFKNVVFVVILIYLCLHWRRCHYVVTNIKVWAYFFLETSAIELKTSTQCAERRQSRSITYSVGLIRLKVTELQPFKMKLRLKRHLANGYVSPRLLTVSECLQCRRKLYNVVFTIP